MTANSLLENLRQKGITVGIEKDGVYEYLDFSPRSAIDRELEESLNSEISEIYLIGLEVSNHLINLRLEDGTYRKWKTLHEKLVRGWPKRSESTEELNQNLKIYAHLVSWSASCLMYVRAKSKLKNRSSLDWREIGGYMADASFASRWIPIAERRLVSTSVLWPAIREKVLLLKL